MQATPFLILSTPYSVLHCIVLHCIALHTNPYCIRTVVVHCLVYRNYYAMFKKQCTNSNSFEFLFVLFAFLFLCFRILGFPPSQLLHALLPTLVVTRLDTRSRQTCNALQRLAQSCTAQNCREFHSTELHKTAMQCIAFHSTHRAAMHRIAVHRIASHIISPNCTALQRASTKYSKLH